MSAYHRYPYNCRSYLDSLVFEYLAGFIDKFLFLCRITVRLKGSSVRETVLINWMWICHLSLYPGSLILHLCNGFYTCACN